MKKVIKIILGISLGIIFLFATTAFIISDPKADYIKQDLNLTDQISLSDIKTENLEIGTFKSSVKFRHNNRNSSTKEFYGQEIVISDNPQVDRILIGITNNLISRIEIWNQNELIETKELGFMNKMTWGQTQTITVAFYDQTNTKYSGESKVSMRFFNGTGFFGDIGTINLELTKYGDLSGAKTIGLFAKNIELDTVTKPEYSDLKIWKNYRSFD